MMGLSVDLKRSQQLEKWCKMKSVVGGKKGGKEGIDQRVPDG